MSISEPRLHRKVRPKDLLDHIHHSHSHHVSSSMTLASDVIAEQIAAHQSYKEDKQAFVSDLTGSSLWTINAISLTALTTYALWAVLRSRRIRFVPPEQLRIPKVLPYLTDSQLEFIILVLPLLGANTVLAKHALVLNAIIAALTAFVSYRFPLEKAAKARSQVFAASSRPPGSNTSSAAPGSRIRHRRHWSRKSSDEDDDEGGEDTASLISYGGSVNLDRSQISPLIDLDDNFRVSIESAADAAHAAAAPPTMYDGPSEHSRSKSSASIPHKRRTAFQSLRKDRLPSSQQAIQRPLLDLDQPITLTTHPAMPSIASRVMTHNSTLSEPAGLPSVSQFDSKSNQDNGQAGSAKSVQRLPSPESTSSRPHTSQANGTVDGSHSLTKFSSAKQSSLASSSSGSPMERIRAEHFTDDTRLAQQHGRRAASDGDPGAYGGHGLAQMPAEPSWPYAPLPGNQNSLAIDSSRRDSATPSLADSPYGAGSGDEMTTAEAAPQTLSAPRDRAQTADLVRTQPFLTVYRSHMMLMTIICILAVDFPAFPRELAKCESWGTSLMDLGVGSFVFSLGLVSALPFLRSPSQRFKPMQAQLLRDLRKSAPVLALGLVRVIMVKSTEYPEHVSEYGVHWNFFITLGLLPIAGTLCRPLGRVMRFSVTGLLIGSIYQIVLWTTGLQDWAISNGPRTGLVEQNKEGLSSLSGYLAIFLLGLDLGHYVLPRDPYLAYRRPSRSRRRAKTDKLAMVLASFAVLWWSGYGLVRLTGARPSRRLANLPYVLWVVAFNTTFLLAYVCVYWLILQPIEERAKYSPGSTSSGSGPIGESEKSESMGQIGTSTRTPSKLLTAAELSPSILLALNTHALPIFLISNLLTGLVNVTIPTMYTPDPFAIAILSIYVAACFTAAIEAQKRNWRLRF